MLIYWKTLCMYYCGSSVLWEPFVLTLETGSPWYTSALLGTMFCMEVPMLLEFVFSKAMYIWATTAFLGLTMWRAGPQVKAGSWRESPA